MRKMRSSYEPTWRTIKGELPDWETDPDWVRYDGNGGHYIAPYDIDAHAPIIVITSSPSNRMVERKYLRQVKYRRAGDVPWLRILAYKIPPAKTRRTKEVYE